ncbi:MAG: hypothetical protein JWR07_210 [Nevskia sp.]|nr:hypothetical protein [Nevskia sp.]
MRSFLYELKRRNVLRAGALYAGAAWALAQGMAQLFPVFGIPDWVVRWFVAAAAIGFPLMLGFSWFYELTPGGLKRESEIDPADSITHTSGKKMDRWIIGTLAVAVALLLADKLMPHKDAAPAADRSIAVLPFANTSGDANNEYFSDGLSEELISSLSRLNDLKVIGRTSSFQFKGKTEDSTAIGRKLGVVYLLEGSVRKSSERVRIAVELVKSADGSNVWSQSYDRELTDIFAVQSEIAGSVASQLQVALRVNTAQAAQAPSPAVPSNRSVEAYTALLQGGFYEQRRTAVDQRKAIGYYEEAVRIDPKYALAYARLATAQVRLHAIFTVQGAEEKELLGKASAAAATALALQPDLGEAHQAQGGVLQLTVFDLPAAAAEYRRAMELAPQSSQTALSLGIMSASFGRLEEGVTYGKRATVLDPLSSAAYVYLARTLDALGRYDEAEAVLHKAIELQPEAAQSYCELALVRVLRGQPAGAVELAQQETDKFWRTFALAVAYNANGRRAEADAALKVLIEEYPDSGAFQIAQVYAQRKEADKVFEWLEHGLASHDPGVTTLRYAAFVNAYSADPRFRAIGAKLGLPAPGEAGA